MPSTARRPPLPSIDDGRRFNSEQRATIKIALQRYIRRKNIPLIDFADQVSHWPQIVKWFPTALLEKPDNDETWHLEKSDKKDAGWAVPRKALDSWINGDSSHGEPTYPPPNNPRLQAITDFLIAAGALLKESLDSKNLDYTAIGHLQVSVYDDLSLAAKTSWIGEYVGHDDHGGSQTTVDLTIFADPEDGILWITRGLSRTVLRREETFDEFYKRASAATTPLRREARGWALFPSSQVITAFLREPLRKSGAIPFVVSQNRAGEFVVLLDDKWPLAGTMTSQPPQLILKKLQSGGDRRYTLKRDTKFSVTLTRAMTTKPDFDKAAEQTQGSILRQVDIDLLHSALAGDRIGMELALQDGADVNCCHPETLETALHLVAKLGAKDAITLLMERPDLNPVLRDEHGLTGAECCILYRDESYLGGKLMDLEMAYYAKHNLPPPEPPFM